MSVRALDAALRETHPRAVEDEDKPREGKWIHAGLTWAKAVVCEGCAGAGAALSGHGMRR